MPGHPSPFLTTVAQPAVPLVKPSSLLSYAPPLAVSFLSSA